MMDSI